MATIKTLRRDRIRAGVRKKISGTAERPRLSIFRTNTSVYAQLINDDLGVTLASVNPKSVKIEGLTKVDASKKIGAEIAKIALSKGITQVVFDRGGFLYHGRVKALADGAREGGLIF